MKTVHASVRQSSLKFLAAAILAISALLAITANSLAADDAKQPATDGTSEASASRVVIYPARAALDAVREQRGITEIQAKQAVKAWVRGDVQRSPSAAGGRGNGEGIVWDRTNLVVEATAARHKQIAARLDTLGKSAGVQIAVECRLVSLEEKEMLRMLPDSTHAPLESPEPDAAKKGDVQDLAFDRPLGSHEGTQISRAQLIVEKVSPVRFRILDKDEGETLLNRCQSDRHTSVLQAPKATVFNGQTATVADVSQTPFVVGLKDAGKGAIQPQIRVVSEGTKLQFRPTADGSDSVHLDFAVSMTKIQKVETVQFDGAASGKTLQVPEVAAVRMEGGASLKPGQWLLISEANPAPRPQAKAASWKDWLTGHDEAAEGASQQLVVMLRVEKIRP